MRPLFFLNIVVFFAWACTDPDPTTSGGAASGGASGSGGEATSAGGSIANVGGDSSGTGGAEQTFPVQILSPIRIETFASGEIPAGTVFNAVVNGEAIHVAGQATGGVEPYTFRWQSDLDGELSSGAEADLTPSEGDHQLVLVATDANGVTSVSDPLPLHVLPKVFDWSHVRRPSALPAQGNWMTPVDNQGSCGSCWAMAAVAAAEAQINIQADDPNLDVNLSQQDVIDCDTHSLGCLGGGTEQSLSGYMHDVGVPLESCVPFVGNDDVCRSTCVDGSAPVRYTIDGTSYAIAPSGGSHDGVRTWMQYQLVNHGPIPRTIVNMYGYDPATHQCAALGGDHYVVVTGYDHAAGLWIAKNSWGANWNGDGYFEIAYDNCAVDASATIVDAVIAP